MQREVPAKPFALCTFCPMKGIVANVVVLVYAISMSIYMTCSFKPWPVVLLSVVAGTLAIWLLFQRDTYLPFLGHMALPATLLKEHTVPANSNAEAAIDVDAEDGARVLYWGARPAKEVQPNPWRAYDDFSNAGIAVVKGGKAVLTFQCPAEYNVAMRGKIDRHVHYRVSGATSGILGPVRTAYVKC